MFTINGNEMLTKVHKYVLFRDNDVLTIDVHEVIAGQSRYNFFSIPNLRREDRVARKEYYGCGKSEEEALEDCLKKIKEMPVQLIVP